MGQTQTAPKPTAPDTTESEPKPLTTVPKVKPLKPEKPEFMPLPSNLKYLLILFLLFLYSCTTNTQNIQKLQKEYKTIYRIQDTYQYIVIDSVNNIYHLDLKSIDGEVRSKINIR